MLFSLQDLAAYLPESAENEERAQLITDLTQGLIYATIPEAIANGSIIATGIGLEVAARAYRNLEGYSSETVDDYTYRRDAATRAAGVYLTTDERSRLLDLDASTARPRVRSVRFSSWSVPQL